jgi:hypothetical protein
LTSWDLPLMDKAVILYLPISYGVEGWAGRRGHPRADGGEP